MEFVNQLPKVVLTGGSRFLCSHLLNNEAFRKALVIGRTQPRNHQYFQKVSFNANDSLAEAFKNKDVGVHLAARAHVINDSAQNPLNEFRNVNIIGILNLAKKAAIAVVKRFIFINTIKVLGEQTTPGKAFKDGNSFNPQHP
tara:strand:+ start:1280 stop:1705 length:426 start_codon:yes stop_codon:yes gene_type:complete